MERRTSGEPFDEAAFAEWLHGDLRRKSVFDAMWARVTGPDMDAAIRTFHRRASERRTLLAGSAAMLLVGAFLYQATPLLELSFASPQRYAAETGAVREIRLSDGTRLTLAGGTRVEVRYTYHNRRLKLTSGAIYADVAHEERRPFRIDTPNASVVDIGTRFEVLSKKGETRVAVTSGIVDFGRSGWLEKPIRLKENQAAILDGANLRRLPDIDRDDVARWRSEWTEYRGVPLRQVISDLDSLSPQRIEIVDEVLAKMPVSGRIRLRDPVGQLQNLAITHNFKVKHFNDVLVVTAK